MKWFILSAIVFLSEISLAGNSEFDVVLKDQECIHVLQALHRYQIIQILNSRDYLAVSVFNSDIQAIVRAKKGVTLTKGKLANFYWKPVGIKRVPMMDDFEKNITVYEQCKDPDPIPAPRPMYIPDSPTESSHSAPEETQKEKVYENDYNKCTDTCYQEHTGEKEKLMACYDKCQSEK